MTQPVSLITNDIEDGRVGLFGLFAGLVDNLRFIVLMTLGFAVLAVAYVILATPQYRAGTLVRIMPEQPSVADFSEAPNVGYRSESSPTDREIQLVTAIGVLGGVVEELDLNILAEPIRVPLVGDVIARQLERRMPGEVQAPLWGLDMFGWGGERLEITELALPERLMEEPLTLVAGQSGAWALEDEDGNLLAEGWLGERFAGEGMAVQVSTLQANPGTRFRVVKERPLTTALRYQQEVEVSEQGRKSGVVSLSLKSSEPHEATRIIDAIAQHYTRHNANRASAEAAASLEFLQAQLPAMRSRLEQSERALNEYQAEAKSIDISLEIQGTLDQLVALDTQISELKLEQADIAQHFTEAHPAYRTVASKIATLTTRQQRLSGRVEGLPETQQELVRLTRNVQVNNEMYTLMLNKTQALDIIRQSTIGNAHVVDPAVFDASNPVHPKKLLIVLIAALAGFLLALGRVLYRKLMYPGIENVEVIERLGLPVYANIPYSKRQPSKRKSGAGGTAESTQLLAATHPNEPAVEAIRNLRTSLHFAMLGSGNNRLMITGPTPSVGKTFVAANLAAVVAQAGQRVLLIDADMRKGYLHRMLQVSEENGLSDVLVGRCELGRAVQPAGVRGLFFISRGRVPPNPSELLMHPNFTEFLEKVSRSFDLVIIDTPPLLAVTDATIVGRQAGANLLVARFDFTAPKELERCIRYFNQNGMGLKGAIFNAVEKRASTTYGYSKSYHGYDYSPKDAYLP